MQDTSKNTKTNKDHGASAVPPRHSALCQRVSLARFGGKPRLPLHGLYLHDPKRTLQGV